MDSLATSMIVRGWQVVADMMEGLTQSPCGCLVSPMSLYYPLSMALRGSERGSGAGHELEEFLCGPGKPHLSEKKVISELGALMREVLHDVKLSEEHKITLLTSMWARPGHGFKTEFIEDMKGAFEATIAEAESADIINAWVKDASEELIPALIDHAAEFSLLLVSAVYLKAPWEAPFYPPEDGGKLNFTTCQGDIKPVSCMVHWDVANLRMKVHEDGIYRAIRLNHQGGAFYTVLTLPEEGVPLKEVMARGLELVDRRSVKGWHTAMEHATVGIPPMKLSTSMKLREHANALGLAAAFEGPVYDRLSPRHLILTDAVQQVLLSMNETGIDATAGSLATLEELSKQPKSLNIFFNRPYLVSVHHSRTHAPVLLGVVLDPPQEHEPPDIPASRVWD